MKAYEDEVQPGDSPARGAPADDLRIAITFKGPGARGPTKMAARLSSASVASFAPAPGEMERAIDALKEKGFVVSGTGDMTVSVRGSRAVFEQTFGTRLSVLELPQSMGYSQPSVYYPAQGAPWKPDAALAALIDDAYIQWPHIYMARAARPLAGGTTSGAGKAMPTKGKVPPEASPAAPKKASKKASKVAGKKAPRAAAKKGGAAAAPLPTPLPVAPAAPAPVLEKPSAKPPKRAAYCLDVLKDVPRLLGADKVHDAKGKGKGVRVVMVDTGFAHSHPFFVKNKFVSSVVLAPGATHRATDPGSHGTGESTNVFAVAPSVTFIGVKLENDADPQGGASILEGFQEALRHDPHVISVSMGYDLREADRRTPLSQLPNGLKALELEIHAAVAKGIVVVFSSGNGHYSFPGQMPEVIAAGGVFVDAAGKMQASDYASAFMSLIYSGRAVPDVCGLVGLLPHADYLMLPIPAGSSLDRECSVYDGTTGTDGWAVFSGTSAAAPQLAGICALLREKNPALAPAAIKALLQRTARDVVRGHANPASDPAGKGLKAGPQRDAATGAGLVDAFAAWSQA